MGYLGAGQPELGDNNVPDSALSYEDIVEI